MTVRQEIIQHLQIADSKCPFNHKDQLSAYLDELLGIAVKEGRKIVLLAWANYFFGLSQRAFIRLESDAWKSIVSKREEKAQMERILANMK